VQGRGEFSSIARVRRLPACLLLFLAIAWLGHMREAFSDAASIAFKVPALPALERHVELLAFPSYLALALENIGVKPSQSSRLVVRDRSSFQIRDASLRYLERKGPVFRYEGRLNLRVGGAESVVSVPVEVDTAALASGTVTIRVYSPLSALLPKDLLDRIEFKIRSFADAAVQQRMSQYLDEAVSRSPGRGMDAMLETILIEAYNRGVPVAAGGRDTGDAEPLSDQWALIATLLIWLVAVPALFVLRLRRRGKPA
jgi:hypothetical protein